MKPQTLTPLKPLGRSDQVFDIDCVYDKDQRQAHIDSVVKRNLPRVTYRHRAKGKVAIVASGPSVTDYVDTLKSWKGEVWCINGALEWCKKRGIKPTAWLGIDPEPILADYLVDPPKDITYYVASQVNPCVFDRLKDHNVRLWFLADRQIKLPIGAVPIPGGTTCLGRAPYLASFMGYTDVHLFGGDSSFTHKTHVHGGALPPNTVSIECNGRMFKSTRTMITQACDIMELVQNFPGEITVYGDGLMQAGCEDIKKSGIAEWLAAEEEKELSHLNRKARRAMKLHKPRAA